MKPSDFPCLLVLVPALGALAVRADGELDGTFRPAPPAGYAQNQMNRVRATPDGVLLYGVNEAPVRRLRPDGSLDAGWKLHPDDKGMDVHLVPMPDGGWAVASVPERFHIVRGDGTVIPVAGMGDPVAQYRNEPVPLPDGSLAIIRGHEVGRILPDGRVGHQLASGLLPIGVDPDVGQVPAGLFPASGVLDSEGRLVVVGQVWHPNPAAVGVVRYMPVGMFDFTWRPAADLRLGDGHRLDAIPSLPAAGPDSSLVLMTDGFGDDGQRRNWVNKLDAGGNLVWSREVALQTLWQVLVQPDGRVLCAGGFTEWDGTPATGLVRLMPDGTRDTGFQVDIRNSSGKVLVYGIELDRDGGLYLSGYFDTVNGEPRPGIAKVRAHVPSSSMPGVEVLGHRHRVATGETLVLSARVTGHPTPSLQWHHDGQPIPGATGPVLRWPITDANSGGRFSVAASNPLANVAVQPPAVEVTAATPRVTAPTRSARAPVPGMAAVTQVVPLADGRVLLAGAGGGAGTPVPLLARLRDDLSLDVTFGDAGVVAGEGTVESVEVLADGGIRVSGEFAVIAGKAGVGVVEFDADGRRRSREYPVFDVAHATATLALPGGGLMVAGVFEKVGGIPAYRLARLNADLSPDPGFKSPLPPHVLVDSMARNPSGLLVIAGARVYRETPGDLPPGLGVVRLLGDGGVDPAFRPFAGAARWVVMEADGRMMAGFPAVRLSYNGGVESRTTFPPGLGNPVAMDPVRPDHLSVRTADGGVVFPVVGPQSASGERTVTLRRWHSDGTVDEHFAPVITPDMTPGRASMAAGLEADGSLLLAMVPASGSGVDVHRYPPDPERRLMIRGSGAGTVQVELPTRPGAWYQPTLRATLGGKLPELPMNMVIGDGYLQRVTVPAKGDAGFLQVGRQ